MVESKNRPLSVKSTLYALNHRLSPHRERFCPKAPPEADLLRSRAGRRVYPSRGSLLKEGQREDSSAEKSSPRGIYVEGSSEFVSAGVTSASSFFGTRLELAFLCENVDDARGPILAIHPGGVTTRAFLAHAVPILLAEERGLSVRMAVTRISCSFSL